MTDNHTDDFLPQDPADKLRAPSNSPFSLPGDDETPAAGLEVVLVQAEIDAHIFDLKTLEKNSQKKSIQKMVDLGPAAVEPLCAYLKHPDRWARMMAAEVLGKIHDPRAIPALKAALNDQHQGVRYMSELALKEITTATSVDQGSPAKGKQAQGNPPLPAKVTARLHPVESRNKAATPKPAPAVTPKIEEAAAAEAKAEAKLEPKPEQKQEPKPKSASGLPEPYIPENLPEIKTLEPRAVPPAPEVLPPAVSVAPPVTTAAPVSLPPAPVPPPEILEASNPPVPVPPAETKPAEKQALPDDFLPFNTSEIAVVGIQSDATDMEQPGAPAWNQEQSSACPVCHQQIKADTRVCPHCHAKFDVSLKGFCPNCRKSVEIDPFDHHCPRCGEEVIDQRYESTLVAFGDIKPTGGQIQAAQYYQSSAAEGIIPSDVGVEEPAAIEEPAIQSVPEQGEFPPIEVPALQEFAERYLAPETENQPSYPGIDLSHSGDEKTPFPGAASVDESGIDYYQPGVVEFPPPPVVPPLVAEPQAGEENPSPSARSADEGVHIRPMFTAAAVASTDSFQEDYGAHEVVPNVRRFAQEGGTPIYVPGQDDGVSNLPSPMAEEPAPPPKTKSQSKPKPSAEKPKPVRKKPAAPLEEEVESQPPKKVEAVFTAEDYFLYGNSLTPPEKTPSSGRKPPQDDGEGRGINPWLIAAPLFLILAGMIYLLYYKATGQQAPYIPAILATEPIPTATFTPEPTPEPTVVIPGWVTDFTAPILTAVEAKRPDFFDNFSVPDAQWGFRDGNKPALGSVTLENEALLMAILRDYGMARQRKVNFNHFAETYDIQFGQNDQSVFEQVFAGSYGSWALHITNTGENWEGTIKLQDPKTEEWRAVQSGTIKAKDALKASLTVMRNGDTIAILVDGEPFMYYEDPALPKTMFHDYYFYRGASQGKVQMLLDNIRIWNLDKFQNLPG